MSPTTPRRRFASPAIAALGLLGLGACAPEIRFTDSIDLELDFRADGGSSLHAPYVEGASLRLRAHDAARDPLALDGYTLVSSDPEVLAVDADEGEDGAISAAAHAVSRGVADLQLVDGDGDVVASAEVEVRAPTRAVLHAAAPLFLRRDDVPTEAFDPTVLTGGLATFAVAYYDGATRLHGSGTLGALASEGLAASVATTHMLEARDWLQISPAIAGLHDVELTAAGQPFARVQVEAVEAEAIADVELRGQNEGRAHRDDELVVIAQAYDEDGDRIFGAAFDWELAGYPDGEPGDLYRYAYQPKESKPIAASFGELRSEATIHADEGWVDSSNHLGCSVNGRTSATGLLPMGLLFVVVLGRRRRPATSAA